MNIQYYGHSCFKITVKPAGRGQEDVSIFIDPFDKSIGLRPPQGSADLVLVTHDHPDHNNVSAIKGAPAIIDIPGEYSVKGVNIIGVSTPHDAEDGRLRGMNTAYLLEAEEIRVCHLGDLGTDLTQKQMEMIDGVDVLLVPIGGKYTLDAKKAVEIIKKVEPNVIIPMHYKINGSNLDIADEKEFCDLIGNCPEEKVSKIALKKKEMEEKSMQVVLMGVE